MRSSGVDHAAATPRTCRLLLRGILHPHARPLYTRSMDLRARVETAVGAAQYALLTLGMARVLGFEDGVVDLDGVRVPFFARGWGVPMLFVHGYGADKE